MEMLKILVRLKLYAFLFVLTVIGDAFFYRLQGRQGLIDWQSFTHAGWAVFSAAFLFVFAFWEKLWLGRLMLFLHFLIFILSFLNQFFFLSEVLNYHCLLFNLGMFTVYYFSLGRDG
jgi:hypothetical protein